MNRNGFLNKTFNNRYASKSHYKIDIVRNMLNLIVANMEIRDNGILFAYSTKRSSKKWFVINCI